MSYKIKPSEPYAVFPLGVKESEKLRNALTGLSEKGLVNGQQLTDLLKGQNLDIAPESGGYLKIYDKNKKEVARVIPLLP
ncbi:MAG: hypothetical protein QXH80_00610 [Candidatus Nanoarchaeia archaeon]